MSTKNKAEAGMLEAVELLKEGNARSFVAAKLQAVYTVSRATSYRWIREAERTLPAEYHQLMGSAGMTDTLAEAQRHYEASLLEGDRKEIRHCLAMVHRFQLDLGRTRPMDAWEEDLAKQTTPPV